MQNNIRNVVLLKTPNNMNHCKALMMVQSTRWNGYSVPSGIQASQVGGGGETQFQCVGIRAIRYSYLIVI